MVVDFNVIIAYVLLDYIIIYKLIKTNYSFYIIVLQGYNDNNNKKKKRKLLKVPKSSGKVRK